MTTPSLILIGLRGSGKTTVARLVADHAGLPCIDLDDRTLAALGGDSVADVWRTKGEPAFRAAEARVLGELLTEPGAAVIALGGGTPTAPGAADLLRDAAAQGRARVVYLRARPATLRARLARTDVSSRPSLTGRDALDEIDSVFAARDGLYQRLASRVIDVDALSAEALALDLAAPFNPPRPPAGPPGRTP